VPDPGQPSFSEVFDDALVAGAAPTEAGDPVQFDPSEVFASANGASVGTLVEGRDRQPRFHGDTSELPPEICWALQELVAAPHVSSQSGKNWPVVLQYERELRSRLSELGLALEVNREFGYAFTRQADDPSPRSRVILRTRTLSLAASALALYLYSQYVVSPDDPVVDTADMIDHMMAYKRAADTDEAGFQRKIQSAIKALDEAWIIKPVKGTSRYVIYGVITAILTAEQVTVLEERYRAIARGDVPGADDDADMEPGEDDRA
jgi:hypothetical protein